ncbi:MAG: hypothetical protein GC129_06965 [Proteobacteria bacterium]|nr:hypothetical protein [Pseudomonadota bacterium]
MQPNHLDLLYQALWRDRRILAVALGCAAGSILYFSWPNEVLWQFGIIGVGVGLLVAAWLRIFGGFVVAFGLAFALAGMQVERAQTTFSWEAASWKAHWVAGNVVEVQQKADNPLRSMLVLAPVRFYQLPGSGGIGEARIGVYSSQVKDLEVGEAVAAPVLLMRPEGPRAPGMRDYRLWKYLNNKVVYGYARGKVEKTAPPPGLEKTQGVGQFWLWVEGVRAKVAAGAEGYGQGVPAALLVGDKRAIPDEITTAYRAAGLSHLLAISGMHLSVVGGGVYLLIRLLLAWVPGAALRWNIKAWAALAGLLAAGGYTLLSGATVGVVRAFLMLGLLLLAAIGGRIRHGLRAWGLAVMVIVLASPALVTSAGFQLSVVAVLALIGWGITESRPEGFWGWLRGLLLSSVVAGAATAPLVLVTFGQLSAVGVLANLPAVPLTALATYIGMAALALWPLGWQGPALWAMGQVVGLVNAWALLLAGWQGGFAVDARWWPVVLVLSLGVLAAVLLRRWALVGVGVAATAALAWGAGRMQPEVEMALLDGGKVGVEREQGPGKGGDFYRVVWAQNAGNARFLLRGTGWRVVGEGAEKGGDWQERLPEELKGRRFAWAVKVGGRWQVHGVACGRVWQRVDELCWE